MERRRFPGRQKSFKLFLSRPHMNITLISRVGTTYQLSSVTFESSNKIIWFLKNVDPQTHKSNFPAGWWAIVSKLSKSTHSDWNFMSNVAACGWMPFHCPCVRTCAQKGFCIFQICRWRRREWSGWAFSLSSWSSSLPTLMPRWANHNPTFRLIVTRLQEVFIFSLNASG